MPPLNNRRQQVCAAIGTEGTEPTWSTVEAAANAAFLIYDPTLTRDLTLIERNPNRAQTGSLPGVPGSVFGSLNFTCELKGSGTAGVAPKIGPLLRACGMSETIQSGSAQMGTVVRNQFNVGTVAPTMLAVAIAEPLSGTLDVQVETVTTNTSVAFQATFRPGDGSTPRTALFTQNSATAVTLSVVLDGATVDFGNPSVSTSGMVVGDRFTAPFVSASQAGVQYKMIDTGVPVVDLSQLQDGRARRLYSARGTYDIACAINDFGKINFAFQGVPVADADVALLSGIGYETTIPPPFFNLTGTLLAGENPAPCFTSFSLALNNEVVMRQCSVGHTTGFASATLPNRGVTAEIDPEAALIAAVDFFALQRAGTPFTAKWVLGATAGNIVTFETTNAQIASIAQNERDGNIIDGLSLRLNQPPTDGGSGYSEFTLTFS